jgi:hypothetical protein
VAPDPEARLSAADATSIDLRCLRCGASQTYKLVPDRVHTTA